MANGVVMPPRSSASQISGSTPSSRKVVTMLSSLVGCRMSIGPCGGPGDRANINGIGLPRTCAPHCHACARPRIGAQVRRGELTSILSVGWWHACIRSARRPRGVPGPRLPRGGRRPPGGDLLRRDLGVRAAGRGLQDGARHPRQGGPGEHGERRARPRRTLARAARRARRRPVRGDGCRSSSRSRSSTATPRRPTGTRGSSRRTSATVSPPTSTARSRRTSTPRPATSSSPRWRTPARPTSSSTASAARSRRSRRWPDASPCGAGG